MNPVLRQKIPVRLRISQCCQERLNDNRSLRVIPRYDQNWGRSSRTESLQARGTATMGAGPASRHWRRYLRFSLRGLIVVVLVIGVGLGWIIRSARIQREAVAAIQNAGGVVIYDWEWSNGKSIAGGKPWAPRWLVDLMGVDYFGHVTLVWLHESSTATDATFAHVGRLAQLQQLNLFRSPVSDADLVHLKGLTKLTALYLNDTPVTDAGLAHVKGLTNLSDLGLGGTQVTDIGLAKFEAADQAQRRQSQRYSRERRRDGASTGTDEPQAAETHRCRGHGRRVGASEGADQAFPHRSRRPSGQRRLSS